MASEVVSLVPQLVSCLHDFLQHASQTRKASTSGHILQQPEFDEDVTKISDLMASSSKGLLDLSVDNTPHFSAFETAARQVFYELLALHTIDSPGFVAIWNLLDFLQRCIDRGLGDTSLVFWLIEELLDTQTIHGCRKVFDFLEPRREVLTQPWTKMKPLIILRSCNELLRRLSRAEDTVFCGRVYIFMFQSFPLGDKSAVNLRGEFHVENVTIFDKTPEKVEVVEIEVDDENKSVDVEKGEDELMTESEPKPSEAVEEVKDDKMKIDTDEKPVKDTSSPKIPTGPAADEKPSGDQHPIQSADSTAETVAKAEKETDKPQVVDSSTLYPIFWSLQEIYSNPPKIFVPENFDSFKRGLESTVKKFNDVPKVLQSHGPPRIAENDKNEGSRKRKHSDDDFASKFNPRYLTSRDLFELELSDLTFQRHILVQSLILIDFLLSQTPKAKKKLLQFNPQKAVLYDFTLGEEDAKWATNMRSTIASYLQEGPEGKFYYRMVDNVLSRDKGWVSWKAENCPPMKKPAISAEEYTEAVESAKKASASKRLRPMPLNSMDLSFLSENENAAGLQKLEQPERYTAPSLETLVNEVTTAELDMDFADGEEKAQLQAKKQNSTWRALRIASKSRLNMFDKVEDGKNLEVLVKPPPEPTPEPPAPAVQSVETETTEEAPAAAAAPVEIQIEDADAESKREGNETGERSEDEQDDPQAKEELGDHASEVNGADSELDGGAVAAAEDNGAPTEELEHTESAGAGESQNELRTDEGTEEEEDTVLNAVTVNGEAEGAEPPATVDVTMS